MLESWKAWRFTVTGTGILGTVTVNLMVISPYSPRPWSFLVPKDEQDRWHKDYPFDLNRDKGLESGGVFVTVLTMPCDLRAWTHLEQQLVDYWSLELNRGSIGHIPSLNISPDHPLLKQVYDPQVCIFALLFQANSDAMVQNLTTYWPAVEAPCLRQNKAKGAEERSGSLKTLWKEVKKVDRENTIGSLRSHKRGVSQNLPC